MIRIPRRPGAPAPGVVLAALLVAGLGVVLGGCVSAPIDSQALIEQGRHAEGLAAYDAAMRQRPNDAELRIRAMRAREQVIGRLIALGITEATSGRHDAARSVFDEVLALDPNNARALAGLAAIEAARRHASLAEDAAARLAAGDVTSAELMVRSILAENPAHPLARDLEQQLRDRERKAALALPALKSRMQAPVNLEFRDAPLRLIMEALARSAGINFIFDRDIRADQRASIFVRGVRVEDALDMIIENHQLQKKVLSENTVLVYPATPQKLREHQELVMRTFHLGNADAKQTLNLLRTMLKTRDMFVDERSNLLVMRDTPEVIRAAEKLIAAQDKADPEVLLELEILEVSRSKVRDLGITWPTTFTGPGGNLDSIRELNRSTIGVDSGFGLRALRTDGETRTLANPRVRVRNKEKARVHVGDRVPVISSTIVGTSPGGSSGNTPVTTEQIQYLDVGIKIEAEPTIHPDDTVGIRINLDVSSLGTQIKTNAGTTAYEVGTRNASTVLRLRHGETQALMGLIRDDDVRSGSGLPFVGEAPVLDTVFGTKRTDQRSRELVLLITPQIVRGSERSDATLMEFWSGTEATVRTRLPFAQSVAEAPGRGPGSAGAAGGAPGSGTAGAAGGAGAAAPAAAAAAAVTVPPPLRLSWQTPPLAVPGEAFTVELRARSASAVKGASLQLRFDPAQIEVLGVEDGGFFASAAGPAAFTPRVDAAGGVVFATIGGSGPPVAATEGVLLRLRLMARRPLEAARLQLASVISLDGSSQRVPIEGSAPLELKSKP